jgi:flavin-dependent dehydrogenase
MAAIALARRKLDVLLVDRATFPRSKVCGCCLNGAALAALDEAGLGQVPREHGAKPLHRLRLAAPGRAVELPLGRSAVLSREVFDAALAKQAIATGAAFLPGASATLGESSAESRTLSLHSSGMTVRCQARVVVAADGLGGRLLSRGSQKGSTRIANARVGAGTVLDDVPDFYQSGTIYMACGEGGYVGLVRTEDGRLDIASALDLKSTRSGHGPGRPVQQLIEQVGWPVPPGIERSDWKGTRPMTWRAEQISDKRVFAIGDAAEYIEPFTGEGIARALTGGLAVASIAARAAHGWDEALRREWEHAYRRSPGRRQLICRVAAAVLRRPRLAGGVVSLLAFAPALAAPVVRYLDTPYSPTFKFESS